jgi:predicted nuclease of predicted toxin-antitoxin system
LTGILIDENVPNNVKEWLKSKGLNITNVSETSLKKAKDYAIAEYAAKNNMTILTLDTDFAQIYHTLKKGTPLSDSHKSKSSHSLQHPADSHNGQQKS